MQEEGKSCCYRILCVITGCGGGDWPPLIALAESLHRRGHDLMVVCDTSTLQAVEASGMKALCLPQELDLAKVFEPAISRLLTRKEKLTGGGENPLEIWGVSCVDYIIKSLNGWCPALVITSLLGIGLGGILTKKITVPWCFLNPSFYFGHSNVLLWDTDFSEMGVQMYRHWLLSHTKKANLVLHATDPVFDICPSVLPSHHKYVGPLFWEMPGNGQESLQKTGSPWVLIAVSTSPQPGDMTIVKTALKALDSMSFRVLVTLAPGHNKDDLGEIPPNVHVMGYTPHSKVLPHCRLVISHAGHGIVIKSMYHGIPMVLLPWGRDQPGVAVRAERMGTAVVVAKPDCSVHTLAAGIEKILSDPQYLERSQVASCRLRKIDGATEAVEHIEQFLGTR